MGGSFWRARALCSASGRRVGALVSSLAIAISLTTSTASQASTTPAPPDLAVTTQAKALAGRSGTETISYLTDAQGRAIPVHAVTVGRHLGAPATGASARFGVTADDLADIARRGFSVVRIAVIWSDLEPSPGQFDGDYLQSLTNIVDAAGLTGLRVIIDLHQDLFGEAFGGIGYPKWVTEVDGEDFQPLGAQFLTELQPALQNAWHNLLTSINGQLALGRVWSKLAESLAGHEAVLGYQLLEAPYGRSRAGESFAQTATRIETEVLGPLFVGLTEVIQHADPGRWVFWPTSVGAASGRAVGYTEMPPGTALLAGFAEAALDWEIGSAAVSGASASTTNRTTGSTEPFDNFIAAAGGFGATKGVPVIAGPWQVPDYDLAGVDEYVYTVNSTFDRSTAGWIYEAWGRGAGAFPLDATGADKPQFALLERPYPLRVAGRPIDLRWNADKRTLSFGIEPVSGISGPTEIFMAETDAEAYDVAIDGHKADIAYDPQRQVLTIPASNEPIEVVVGSTQTVTELNQATEAAESKALDKWPLRLAIGFGAAAGIAMIAT